MDPLDRLMAGLGRGRFVVGSAVPLPCPPRSPPQFERPKQLNDGTLLIYCQAGCLTEDVLDSIGLTMADLYPSRSRQW